MLNITPISLNNTPYFFHEKRKNVSLHKEIPKHGYMRKYITFLALLMTMTAWAQPYSSVRTFSLRDGLASNVISSMVQTHDQLMWFSSWNGLSCYDGYTFTTFSDKLGYNRTLTTNRMLKLSASPTGNIWCLTYDRQVFLFDRISCRFINISDLVNRVSGKAFVCQRCVSLPNGSTWLFSRNEGEACYRIVERGTIDEKSVQKFCVENGMLKGNVVYGTEMDDYGHEWVLTDGGPTLVGEQLKCDIPFIYMKQVGSQVFFAARDGQFSVYDATKKTLVPLRLSTPIQQIQTIEKLSEDQLLLLTDKGFLIYHIGKKSSRLLPNTSSVAFSSIYLDKQQRIWAIAEKGGIMLITPNDGNMRWLSTLQLLPSLRQSTRSLVHQDRNGTFWLATEEGFFGYYDEQNQLLVPAQIRTNAAMPSLDRWFEDSYGNIWFSGEHDLALINFGQHVFNHVTLNGMQQIRSVCYDSQNRLWAGDLAGHIAVMNEGNQLIGYLATDGKIRPQLSTFSSHIYCLYEDSQRRMWIGTKGDGLYCLHPNGSINHYRHDEANPYSLCSDQVYDVHEDSKHRIWIGTFEKGICLMQTKNDGQAQFIHTDNILKGYPVNDYHKIRRITETADGNIIVSASNGLVTFSEHFSNPATIRFFAHKHEQGDTTSLLTSDVMHSFVTHDGRIFVATVGGGVQEIVDKQPLKEHLFLKVVNSMDDDNGTVLSIIEDKDHNLWMGRENSLVMKGAKTGQLWRFGPGNLGERVELTEAEPTYNPRTGQLAFATTSGYVSFYPQQIAQEAFVPPLVINSVYFHGSRESVHMLPGDSLDVPANQRNFTVHFSALDYQDNYMIRYAYMMEGVDHDWNYLDNEHSISFSNLSHGHHRLLIRSTNQYGSWVNNTKTLYIYVHPTFWESWWAKLLYLLLMIGAIAVAVWIYRLRTRASMERQLNDMKTQFFTDISHKLRTPLTLIGGPVTQVLEEGGLTDTARKHLEMVKRNAHRMLELVNRMLTYSKEHNTYISDENAGSLDVNEMRANDDETSSTIANVNADSSSMLKLLIVEDNEDLRAFLVSILSSDYSVIQAANGREGLETALREQPDFILTDVMMPEMDGLEMVHRIKDNTNISHIPIVILSAKASLDDRLEGLKAGVNDYITKPFSATYLKQRMQNIISNQRLLQQSNLEHINQAVDEQGLEESHTLKLRATNIVDSDKQMMEDLLTFIEDNIANAELKIDDLANAVNMGRTVFYNKVKTIVGMSPVELLRHIRIQHAEDMIAKSNEPFSQIAYAVGFSDSRYFGKCFKKQTGLTPSEYRDQSVKSE